MKLPRQLKLAKTNPSRWLALILTARLLACHLPVQMTPAGTALPAAFLSPTPTAFQPLPVVTSTEQLSTATPVPTPTSTAVPQPTYQPVFEPAECAFYIPAGYQPECGYLVVPENRAVPGSPSIRLHVAIFRSLASQPAPDPVIHLAGGPGSSSLDEAAYLFSQGLGAILEQRDFILFDQRGTGHSQPRLDCPERQALTGSLLQDNPAPAQAEQLVVDAFRRCRERL